MYIFVYKGEISGHTESYTGHPEGWECLPCPGEAASLSQVYLKEGRCELRPPRPNDGQYYTWRDDHWEPD